MVDDNVTEYPTRRLRLYPCQSCGRQFNPESLNKHQAICRKVSTTRRRVFDAGKQRATDSDVPYKATKKTAQIYRGEVVAQEDRSKTRSKSTWREKHRSLVQAIREARTVTQAMKEGGPLPAFQPSAVPSDYVACPYCRRHFNAHTAKRHIPFCQTQRGRKHPQPCRPHQQPDRGRSLPPSQPQQQPSYSRSTYPAAQIAPRGNSYQYSNSAPMLVRKERAAYPQAPLPRAHPLMADERSFRRLFGLSSSKEASIPSHNYYGSETQYEYEPQVRRSAQPPMIIRTGRSQENTHLNVLARHRNDEGGSYVRRMPPPTAGTPLSYSQSRYPFDQQQYNSIRSRTTGRLPPSNTIHCGECGSVSNNVSARYCAQCGYRR